MNNNSNNNKYVTDNILYFERSNGERVPVGTPTTRKELNDMMNDYIHKLNPNFKIYYTRIIQGEDEVCFDVGSHTEFFYFSYTAYKDMK